MTRPTELTDETRPLTDTTRVGGTVVGAGSGAAGEVPIENGDGTATWGPVTADIVEYDDTVTGLGATDVQAAIEAVVAGGGSGGLPWFILSNYGAVGDGTTDDTAAREAWVAAYNAAGGGVLYAPAPSVNYKITGSGLTAIEKPGLIIGDGLNATKITNTSATEPGFTIDSAGVVVRDLYLSNSHASPSAGAGIIVTTGGLNRYENLFIDNYWIGIDHQHGIGWIMQRLFIQSVRKYGIRISQAASPDDGDWGMTDVVISDANARSADAALRIESSGGGKIVNFKVNGSPTTGYNHGIDLAVAASVDTGLLQVTNASIENIRGDGLHGTTSAGTSKWGTIILTNFQVALYTNNAGKAVSLVATTAGDFHDIQIDASSHLITNGTARTAMQFTNCDQVRVEGVTLDGFNGPYTATTCTNFIDDTGSLAGVAITGTPSAGQVPTATSGTAATWQTPAAVVSALDDLSDVTITAPAAADRLRYSGSVWVNSALRWEPHVAYDGTVVLDGNGDPVMVEVA